MSAVIAFVVLHLALAAEPPAAPRGEAPILWFRPATAPASETRALADAIATYTRDLGVTIVAGPEAPQPGTDAGGEAAAAVRAHGARLGFWCDRQAGERAAVLTIVAADGQLQRHAIEETPGDEPELNRATALKLRTILVEATRPPAEPAPPPVPPPPAPSAAPADAGIARRASPLVMPVAPGRPFIAAGYRVAAPLASGPVRQGLAIEGGILLRRYLELAAGSELSLPLESRVGEAEVSVFDLPVSAGARLVRKRGWLVFGVGGSAALHLLWASASAADGRQGRSFSLAAGAGVEALARAHFTRGMACELRLYADVPLPTTGYLVGDTQALQLGARLGAGIGFVYQWRRAE